jgi:hypothetical protein
MIYLAPPHMGPDERALLMDGSLPFRSKRGLPPGPVPLSEAVQTSLRGWET